MPADELEALERLVSHRLRRLPTPQAPATLHARVMTAVSATRPAVRPWSVWPRVWQSMFALGLATIAASGVVIWSTIAANARGDAWWQIGVQAAASVAGSVGAMRDGFSIVLSWCASLAATPAAVAVMALIAFAALAFIVLGVWLRRIALPPLAWSKGVSR